MKIRIKDSKVITDSGISKKTGKPYEMHYQVGEAETEKFRAPCRISVKKPENAWPVGEYFLDFNNQVNLDGFGEFRTPRYPELVRLDAIGKSARAA